MIQYFLSFLLLCVFCFPSFVFSNPGASLSDSRLKTDIRPLVHMSLPLSSMRGVTFLWDGGQLPGRQFPKGRQIGFIAQETLPFFPEMVTRDEAGFYYVAYEPFTAVLTQVIKENHDLWQQVETENVRLEARLNHQAQILAELLEQAKARVADERKTP